MFLFNMRGSRSGHSVSFKINKSLGRLEGFSLADVGLAHHVVATIILPFVIIAPHQSHDVESTP